MVMTALAWSLKAWWALSLREQPPLAVTPPDPEAAGPANGIPHFSQRLHQNPVPDPPHRATIGVSRPALQRAFARVLPAPHGPALLTEPTLKPEGGAGDCRASLART